MWQPFALISKRTCLSRNFQSMRSTICGSCGFSLWSPQLQRQLSFHQAHYSRSFLPCDHDFALIEKLALKNARPSNPFQCVTVDQQMVYDFCSHFAKLFKNAYKSEGRKICVRDTKVYQYSDSHQTEVWVRYSMSELAPWEKFSVEKFRALP